MADELKIGGSANPELLPVVRGWAARRLCGSSSAASPSSTRTARGRASGHGPRWRRTSTSWPASTRRSSFATGEEPPLDRFAIAGTPEEVAARVIALWDAGADRVELGTPQGRTTREGVRLICERVLPLLRR